MATFVARSLISGLSGTYYIEKKGLRNLDYILKILLTISFASLISMGMLFSLVDEVRVKWILIGNGVLGVGLIGIVPFAFASLVESSFPVQEAISTNTINLLLNITSVSASHASVSSGRKSFLILAAFAAPCWLYGVFFHKTEYKKQEADESHKNINDGDSCLLNDNQNVNVQMKNDTFAE